MSNQKFCSRNSTSVFARSCLDHKPKGQVTDKFQKPDKNYTSPNFFFWPKDGRFGNFNMILLPEKPSSVALICVSD